LNDKVKKKILFLEFSFLFFSFSPSDKCRMADKRIPSDKCRMGMREDNFLMVI
jgi:hypothetical protein